VTIIQTKIPTAGIPKTNINFSIYIVPVSDYIELLPITKAAHVD